jgi:hypothetical protein
MRKQSAALILPLGVFAIFGFPGSGYAATIAAASCTQAAVNTALASATYGDTVTVPSGSCSWASQVTITKGITFKGAGVDSTIITNTGGDGTLLQLSPDATSIANENHMTVSGFTFDGGGSGYALIGMNGAPDTGTKPYRYVIITGNKFQNTGGTSGNGNTCIYNYTGQTRGVISGNTFDKCDMIFRPMGSDTTTEWTNTAYNNFSYGSEDNLYFENNTIIWSSSYNPSDAYGGWIESHLGSQSEFWDIHGFQNWNGSAGSGQTGTMIAEYYNNQFTNGSSSVYRWMNHRGSWLMMFGNTYSGATSPDIEINQYAQGDSGGSGCVAQINPTPVGYIPQVNNTYVFNNFVNGVQTVLVPGDPIGNGCGTAENISYWNYAASFNGTVGVGSGPLSAMPSTCTTGVGYWATDQGSWNHSGSGGQGVLYKCLSTNNWAAYYTPYTYPHPLLSQPPPPPQPPTALSAITH